MIYTKTISTTFRLILCVIIAVGLYQEIYVNGVFVTRALYYFTIQSNILTMVCLLLFIFIPRDNKVRCLLRGAVLLAITVTGVVYNFVLFNIFKDWGTAAYSFTRTATHIIAPIGFILDWVLFDKHGIMKAKDVFVWMIYPLVYCGFSVYANLRYGSSLYFFFDLSKGYVSALLWLNVLFGAAFVIGVLFVGTDRLLGRVSK